VCFSVCGKIFDFSLIFPQKRTQRGLSYFLLSAFTAATGIFTDFWTIA